MANLALLGERHDFAEVVVVAPEGTVIGVLSGDEGKERDVDSVADEADGGVMSAGREKAEAELDHVLGAGAVDDSIELAAAGGFGQLFAKIVERFAGDANGVIGTEVFRDGELLVVTREGDDGGSAGEQLRVLNSIGSKAPDTEDGEDAIGAEDSGVAQFFDAAVGREAGVGERGQLLGLEASAIDLDEVAGRDGDVLAVAAVGSEAGPAAVLADLGVAALAVAAGAVSPATDDDDLVAFGESGGFRDEAADAIDRAGDLVAGRKGKLHLGVPGEVAVDQLEVGAAHSCRLDFDENFIGGDFGDGNLFEDQRLTITVHACCSHG